MALNAFKYIFASAREAGGGAAALTFSHPSHSSPKMSDYRTDQAASIILYVHIIQRLTIQIGQNRTII